MNIYVYLLISFIWHNSVKSLTFITENNHDDGQWTFEEGSTVKLVCTNYPYTGILTFTFDSKRVLSCTASVCLQNDSYEKMFSFIHDTDSGIFTWIINTVNMTCNDKVFECDDGLIHKRNTVKVNMVKGGLSENSRKAQSVAIAIVLIVCSLFVLMTYLRLHFKNIKNFYIKCKGTDSDRYTREGKYQRRRGNSDEHVPMKYSL